MEWLEISGHRKMDVLLVCGGLSKQHIYMTTLASAVCRTVAVPRQAEAVLGGTAILAACAAGLYPSVQQAITAMAGIADVISPNQKAVL